MSLNMKDINDKEKHYKCLRGERIFKTLISEVIILFLFGFVLSAHAATVTWTGGGTDNLASNPANWSGNIAPQYGDDVVFDSTSKDCTWDINVRLNSLAITSGYTGTVILNATLIISDSVIWTGNGSDNLASNPYNWLGNRTPQNGDKVVFDETSSNDCIWDINAVHAFLSLTGYTGTITLDSNLTINGNLTITSGTLNLNNKTLNVDGYLLIGADGTLNATSSTVTVKGNWSNYGIFNYGTSTVIFNGINQTIYGNTTFYNLTKTVTSADTLYFESGSTQTIVNSLTLQGASSGLLALRSTQNGQYWYIETPRAPATFHMWI